ncbi:hypothetical protein F4779DRAFT_598986 [Xylariaceae sp. FL0662B]|nr:hypothetical protein F4779DRAFT_598986 [Xylariaceae sp. FL0662B]
MKVLQALWLVVPLGTASRLDRRGKVTYDGYKVFRTTPQGGAAAFEAQIESLNAVDLTHNHGYGGEAYFDIAVPPEHLAAFEALNNPAEVLSEDLGADISLEGDLAEYPGLETGAAAFDTDAAALPSQSWFDAYHAYDDHITYLEDLQASFPENSELITAGSSFENRAIQGIHFWGSGGKDSKPAVYFHGNVHAREWISSKVVEYLAYQFIANYNNDTTVKDFVDSYDFYILPIVNPDGFVYTQTDNRMWRKNRQIRSGTSAIGTDVNRNWPYEWDGEGSSTSPGSGQYRGEEAGDTPENTGIRELADQLGANNGIKLYIDWHSYGQYILTPYGYSCSATVANSEAQNQLAMDTAAAIAKSYGTRFTTGPICETLYVAAGGSNDYVTDVSKAEFGWAIELRDTGRNGFVLPADQILPSCIEAWEGMKYLFANM